MYRQRSHILLARRSAPERRGRQHVEKRHGSRKTFLVVRPRTESDRRAKKPRGGSLKKRGREKPQRQSLARSRKDRGEKRRTDDMLRKKRGGRKSGGDGR